MPDERVHDNVRLAGLKVLHYLKADNKIEFSPQLDGAIEVSLPNGALRYDNLTL